MPTHRQPATLYVLAHETLSRELIQICRYLQQKVARELSGYQVLAVARKLFRPSWIILPGQIRATLLNQCVEMITSRTSEASVMGTGPGPLYLLTLLLGHDIKEIQVDLCCYYGCSHQAMLLQLLSMEGTGLESLELSRSALLRLDCQLLEKALMSMSNLRKLTLRNIANDAVLKVIGETCKNLIFLDVEHSRQVTDVGIKSLFLNVELTEKAKNEKLSRPRAWLRRLMLAFRMGKKVATSTISKFDDLKTIFISSRAMNPISNTVKVLKIANSGVSCLGVVIALHCAPNLESLGEFCHLGRAFEILERVFEGDSNLPLYKLVTARCSRITKNRMELMAYCCPSIRKLTMSEPLCPPQSIELFQDITSINIQSVPINVEWLQGFYRYLQTAGNKLYLLTLRFFPGDVNLARFDVSAVLEHCPNLKMLIQDGAQVEWNGSTNFRNDHLRQVQLGKTVTKSVLINLVKAAPKIRSLHIYNCETMNEKDISVLNGTNIECFFIYEVAMTESELPLTNIFMKCPSISKIGNLLGWGFNVDKITNIREYFIKSNMDLSLTTSSHWFCSECFD